MGDNTQKLQEIAEKVRQQGKKIALCHGCFDGLHEGHIRLFQKARKISDLVIIGIEKDEYLKKAKGDKRPFYKLRDRIRAIIKTGLVDYAFVVPTGSTRIYKKLYLDLKPDYLVTALDEVIQKKKRDAIEAGIKVIIIKEKEHHSRDRIHKERNIKSVMGNIRRQINI